MLSYYCILFLTVTVAECHSEPVEESSTVQILLKMKIPRQARDDK